jgi:anti-sigma factor RsiW
MTENSERSEPMEDRDSRNAAQTDCEELRTLIPAYAMGATDPEEEAVLKAKLAHCPELAEDLASYSALAEAMLYSAPMAEAPLHLEDRLRLALEDGQRQPSRPVQEGWLETLRRWLTPSTRQLNVLAYAAALLVLVITNLYWGRQVGQLKSDQAQILARLETQTSAMVVMMTAENLQRVELPPVQENSAAHAEIAWVPDKQIAVLYTQAFPPLSPDMVYQLWLIRGEDRISGGLFRVDPHGSGVLVIEAPEPIDHFDAFGITPEPAPGSAGPTAPPIVRGRMS